jgi:hypothetical protein
MWRVSVGWKDQLAALKHVFPQFPTDTRLIWQRPHADFNFKNNFKSNRTVKSNSLDALASEFLLTFIPRNIRTPRLRADRGFGFTHHIELAVRSDFTNHYRFVQVMISSVHF